MNTNTNVRARYRLSPAGQKAALLCGRPATAEVVEEMELTDKSLIEYLDVDANGGLSYDARSVWCTTQYFDAPPVDLDALIAWHHYKEAENKTLREQEKLAATAESEKRQYAAVQKMEEDAPAVEALLFRLEAQNPLSIDPLDLALLSAPWNFLWVVSGKEYSISQENASRHEVLAKNRWDAIDAAAKQKRVEREQEITEMVKTHGGYVFYCPSGICGFTGFQLWSTGQSKRWVGVFSTLRGIDTFLQSPRGEFVFDVSALTPGECIQGAGYDTKYNGKKRNETEWFGVVVSNIGGQVVVKIYDSRSDALKARTVPVK